MNSKWCVSTLFIILALLGLSQEQKKTSNQQISLEFADVERSSNSAHDEILAVITKKLEVLGVDAIEVIENDERQLSIRYYSDVDAESVKKFLSEEGQFTIGFDGEKPVDNQDEQLPGQYNLVVLDLHQQIDNGFQLKATLVTAQDYKFEITYNSFTLPVNNEIAIDHDVIDELAIKINRDVAITVNNTSHNIPEVRAGPQGNRNS